MIQRENQIKHGQIKEVILKQINEIMVGKKNDIEMYSTHNEGKVIFTERFIRTLKIRFTNI